MGLCLGVTFALISLGIALFIVVVEGGGQAAWQGLSVLLGRSSQKRSVSL